MMQREQGVSILKFITLTTTAFFAGGAVFINVAEHPARKKLAPSDALIEWKESYDRASVWQAANATIGFLAGVATTYLTGDRAWATGGSILGAVVPYTLLLLMPTNNALKQASKKLTDAEVCGHHQHRDPSSSTSSSSCGTMSCSTTLTKKGEEDGEDVDEPMWTMCLGTFAIRGTMGGQIKTLLKMWGGLHGVRSVLGTVALCLLTSHVSQRRKA